jgi:hypothetical protein
MASRGRRGCWLIRAENGRFPGGRAKPALEAAKLQKARPESFSGCQMSSVFSAGGMLRGLVEETGGISAEAGGRPAARRAGSVASDIAAGLALVRFRPLRGGAGADAEFLANMGEGPSGAPARFPLGSSGLSTFRRKEPKKATRLAARRNCSAKKGSHARKSPVTHSRSGKIDYGSRRDRMRQPKEKGRRGPGREAELQ